MQKGLIKSKLTGTQKRLSTLNTGNDFDEYCQGVAFEELDILIGKIKGATSFKSINIMNNLSSTEKKIFEKIFNGIIEYNPEGSSEIIDFLIKYYLK